MGLREQVNSLVLKSIEEINKELDEDDRIDPSLSTPLNGPKTEVDSLTLVNLIVNIEEQIEDVFDVIIALADDNAIATGKNPFNTVGTLIDYVYGLLSKS